MLAVEVSHVVKSFTDKVAVEDLSLSVTQGEILGLIGPNGASKTTTIYGCGMKTISMCSNQ